MAQSRVVVYVTSEALDELAELPATIVKRMRKLVDRLQNWPDVSGIKKLKGALAGKSRMRTGDYRLQFRVAEKNVEKTKKSEEINETWIIVEKVGHRDGFYDD